MKKLSLIFIMLFLANSVFSQDIEWREGIITPIQTYESDSLDFFIVEDNSRLFKAPKGKFKILRSTIFLSLKHDQNSFIIDIKFPPKGRLKNISGIESFNCKPVSEKSNTKKYTYQEIVNSLEILKNLENKKGGIIDWTDRGSCDGRAIQAYRKLKKQNFSTLKIIALVSDSIKSCYAPKKNVHPLWLYHVANAMHCDDNKYYVLDPFLDNGKPIELEEWKEKIIFGEKDCERFVLYANNCRVIGRPTVQNKKLSYKWTVGCGCDDPVPIIDIISKKGKAKKKVK